MEAETFIVRCSRAVEMPIIMKRILIIEDDLLNSRVIENSISENRPDIEVVTAGNGSQGIFNYLTPSFDLVFLDIMMPRISGYHFLTIIEDNLKAGLIELKANIVVQTGIQSFVELNSLAEKEVVQDVIRKPITVKQVIECVEMYC